MKFTIAPGSRWVRNKSPVHPIDHSCQPQPPKVANARDLAIRGMWGPSTCVLHAREINTNTSRSRWVRNQNPVHPLDHSCQPQPPKVANSRDLAIRGLWEPIPQLPTTTPKSCKFRRFTNHLGLWRPSTCVLHAREINTSRSRWVRNQNPVHPLDHSCQPQPPKVANSRDPCTCVLDAHEINHYTWKQVSEKLKPGVPPRPQLPTTTPKSCKCPRFSYSGAVGTFYLCYGRTWN